MTDRQRNLGKLAFGLAFWLPIVWFAGVLYRDAGSIGHRYSHQQMACEYSAEHGGPGCNP
jgi:hypothetical protein